VYSYLLLLSDSPSGQGGVLQAQCGALSWRALRTLQTCLCATARWVLGYVHVVFIVCICCEGRVAGWLCLEVMQHSVAATVGPGEGVWHSSSVGC
jgi:hypothetical protein